MRHKEEQKLPQNESKTDIEHPLSRNEKSGHTIKRSMSDTDLDPVKK